MREWGGQGSRSAAVADIRKVQTVDEGRLLSFLKNPQTGLCVRVF